MAAPEAGDKVDLGKSERQRSVMSSVIPFPPLSPEIFSVDLFGMSFALRWYALAYIAGIVLGWVLAVRLLKRPTLWRNDSPPMTPAQLEDLMTWIILGIILGGRLGFVLFYQPGYYLANPGEILMIWQGGMSFHGGLIGVILAIYLYARKYQIPFLAVGDFVAPMVPTGLFFGRIGNFIGQELYGRATDGPWAMLFPSDPLQLGRHPSQLYEAFLEGVVLFFIIYLNSYIKS